MVDAPAAVSSDLRPVCIMAVAFYLQLL